MTSVFVVRGLAGDWQATFQWDVAAYPDRAAAELHASLVQKEHDTLYAEWDDRTFWFGEREVKERIPLDPWICWRDVGGVKYLVAELLLVRHPDEFLERMGK